jgi:MFS family permease
VALPAGVEVVVVLALAAVIGTALGAFRPITSALMPSLVRRPEELVACTASAGLLDGATTIAGPLLAGLLVAVAGPEWAIGATVVLLLVAALFAGRLPTPSMMRSGPADRPRRGGALGTLFASPQAAAIGVLLPCQTFVRGALNVIVVGYVVDTLQLGEGAVGLLLGAIGIGGILAFPAALAIVGVARLYRSLGLGLALWGLPLALAALVPYPVAAVALFAVVGIGNALIDVSAFSALPRAVPGHTLPTAFGVLEALLQIGMAIGAAAAGVLLALVDPRLALVVVGLFLPVVALVAAPVLRRFDTGLEHHDVEVELLRQQPVFESLPMPVLDNLGGRMLAAEYRAGDVIMAEGDEGDRYVLIVDGQVTFSQRGTVINSLGNGAAFGEIALVRGIRRTATAVAATTVHARTLDRDSFLSALGCDPRARAAADATAAERLARDADG